MSGSALTHTVNTLQIFLRSLPQQCIFNIIEFNTYHRSLFSAGAQPYNDDTLGQATEWVKSLRATGGTELLPYVSSNH
jgi:hypothetical protein